MEERLAVEDEALDTVNRLALDSTEASVRVGDVLVNLNSDVVQVGGVGAPERRLEVDLELEWSVDLAGRSIDDIRAVLLVELNGDSRAGVLLVCRDCRVDRW